MKGKWPYLIFACCIAALVFVLRFLDYHYMVRNITTELYVAGIGVAFMATGVWIGNKWLNYKRQDEKVVSAGLPVSLNLSAAELAGLTGREMEVLRLIAEGHSNQEIADKLFVSLNTVKTHSSNLFLKLDVKRRT